MVAYYQHDIAAWMDGTESLDDGEYRVYHVICELIYLNNGPIVMHESGIAGRCNQHPLKFRRNLEKLVLLKKLVLTDGGKITNPRVQSELTKYGMKRRTKDANPPPTPRQPPSLPQGGLGRVPGGSRGGKPSKPLKTNEPDLLAGAEESSREETSPEAIASGVPIYSDSKHELWGEGIPIMVSLGVPEARSRQMIGRWLKSVNDDAQILLGAIQRARDNRVIDPIPWITRSIAAKNGGFGETSRNDSSRVGFAGLGAQLRQRVDEKKRAAAAEFAAASGSGRED